MTETSGPIDIELTKEEKAEAYEHIYHTIVRLNKMDVPVVFQKVKQVLPIMPGAFFYEGSTTMQYSCCQFRAGFTEGGYKSRPAMVALATFENKNEDTELLSKLFAIIHEGAHAFTANQVESNQYGHQDRNDSELKAYKTMFYYARRFLSKGLYKKLLVFFRKHLYINHPIMYGYLDATNHCLDLLKEVEAKEAEQTQKTSAVHHAASGIDND